MSSLNCNQMTEENNFNNLKLCQVEVMQYEEKESFTLGLTCQCKLNLMLSVILGKIQMIMACLYLIIPIAYEPSTRQHLL